ncbi:hypothetical protein ABZX98_26120 [Streptomyces sp. NPDC002992]|uniref:hypothetical protein n=1 Tax=Streptomyces sp. NPDC002992 TaxID=3154273 RepID=UPI0033A6A3CF
MFAYGSRSRLGSVQGIEGIVRGCQQEAEIFFLVLKQRWQRIQVTSQRLAVESGVQIDLLGPSNRQYPYLVDTQPLGTSRRSEELIDTTAPVEGAKDEWFCQIAHGGRLRRDEDSGPKEIEGGPSVHRPLEGFDSVDVAFDDA